MASPFDPGDEVVDHIVSIARERFEPSTATMTPQPHGPAPTRADVGELIDIAFRASFRRDEGRWARANLTLAAPADTPGLVFRAPIPLTVDAVSKLAPALPTDDGGLGIRREAGRLMIWGMLPATLDALVVSIKDPALLHVKLKTKGAPIAVVDGDRAYRVDPGTKYPFQPARGNTATLWHLQTKALLLGAIARMHRNGHGGMILMVAGSAWRRSLDMGLQSFAPYKGSFRAYNRVFAAHRQRNRSWATAVPPVKHSMDTRKLELSTDRYLRTIALIAQLTAVDGALVMNRNLDVLRFGAKIKIGGKSPRVELRTAIVGEEPGPIKADKLWGTRHKSATRFAKAHPGCAAFVASTDGVVSAMEWDKQRRVVDVLRHMELLLPTSFVF